MATPKQEKLAKKITENYRSKKTKTLGKMLEESDYTKSTSEQPSRIIKSKGVQKEIKPILQELEELRQRTITALKEKDLNQEKVQELNNLLKNLNHDIQLLSGGSTERVENILSPEQINELLSRRAKTDIPSR